LVNQGGLSNLGGKLSGTHSQKKEFRTLYNSSVALSISEQLYKFVQLYCEIKFLSLPKSHLRKHLLLVGESKGERVSTQKRQIVSSNVGWYRSSDTTSGSILDTVTSAGFKTNTRCNCLLSELCIKLTCSNDNSNRPSTKSWSDKGVETSESVERDQEMSGRLKSPKTIKRSLSGSFYCRQMLLINC